MGNSVYIAIFSPDGNTLVLGGNFSGLFTGRAKIYSVLQFVYKFNRTEFAENEYSYLGYSNVEILNEAGEVINEPFPESEDEVTE